MDYKLIPGDPSPPEAEFFKRARGAFKYGDALDRARIDVMRDRATIAREKATLARAFANLSPRQRVFSRLPPKMADLDERLADLDEELLRCFQREAIKR